MQKDVDYYLSKGCDRATAEYYAAGRKKIISVTANSDFTLLLGFEGGERRILDCKPFLDGEVFKPFKDFENFKRVYLDDTNCVAWDIDPDIDSNVVWNNKVDLCPDSCYIDSIPIT